MGGVGPLGNLPGQGVQLQGVRVHLQPVVVVGGGGGLWELGGGGAGGIWTPTARHPQHWLLESGNKSQIDFIDSRHPFFMNFMQNKVYWLYKALVGQ